MSRQRSVASNVSLTLGMLTVTCDVVPQAIPNLKKSTGSVYVCPSCITGETPTVNRVSQKYHCTNDEAHGPFEQTALARAREIDDTLVQVTEEELAAVRTSGTVDDKSIDLHVYPSAQFEAATRPGEAGYRLRPPAKAPSKLLTMYGLLMDMASRGDVALVGEFNLRGAEKLYRVNVWTDLDGGRQLCLTEMARPSDLSPLDEIATPPASDKEQALANQLLDLLLEDFDPEDVRNTARERAALLDAAKAENPDVVVSIPTKAAEDKASDDLESLLALALAGTSTVKKAA